MGAVMEKQKILVVDDDKEILFSLSKLLEYDGFEVVQARDGIEALEQLDKEKPDLILLDIMMPKLDGISALMKIRESNHLPVIVLSAKTQDSDKVYGLTMGADDYICKPYNPAELSARVKALLRRFSAWNEMTGNKASVNERICNGGIVLDTASKQVEVDGEQVKLTATEYKIVNLLINNLNRVFSAEEIYERVWEDNIGYAVENTVMVHIRRIREKIEIDTKNPKYIKVVWGIGYKMEKM
jgi:DNA-binding response OmpR family regulator